MSKPNFSGLNPLFHNIDIPLFVEYLDNYQRANTLKPLGFGANR